MTVYVAFVTDDQTRESTVVGVFVKKRDALVALNSEMRKNFADVPRGRGIRPNPFEFQNDKDKREYNNHKTELRIYGDTTIQEEMNYAIKESELTN
uniref:Uncharacterized protein n=1 Tax=Pithovirus LCPAC401 TaxID=2506595 RepID=A0A481ZAW7_9VIRU|nr:MAG: hypothetical protein LCPAC401_04140 [Pithovirus LCPAC401]